MCEKEIRERELFSLRQTEYNLLLLNIYVNTEGKIKRLYFREMIFEWKTKIAFTISEMIEMYVPIHSLPTVRTESRVGAKCDWAAIRIGGNRKSNCFSSDRVWK